MTNPDGCLVCCGNHFKEKRSYNKEEWKAHVADIREDISYCLATAKRLEAHAKSERWIVNNLRSKLEKLQKQRPK